jgi:hypothetical protein
MRAAMCLFFRARRKEIRSRQPLSDDDFCAQVDVPKQDYQFVSDVRRAIGLCCKVPPENIKPDDVFDDYADMLDPTGWDELALVFALDKVTGTMHRFDRDIVKLPPPTRRVSFFGKTKNPGIPLKEWIRQAMPELKKTEVIAHG